MQSSEELEAESRLQAVRDLLCAHLRGAVPGHRPDVPLARRLREMLDARPTDPITLEQARRLLGAHASHLVRPPSRAFGLPPHRYVTGRRIDLAGRLLLDGLSPAETAAATGFHNQAHLTRHLRGMLGTTPGCLAAAALLVTDRPQRLELSAPQELCMRIHSLTLEVRARTVM